MPDRPKPWISGDGPLPKDNDVLIAEIKVLAAARRRDAETHPAGCQCDGCRLIRIERNRDALHRRTG